MAHKPEPKQSKQAKVREIKKKSKSRKENTTHSIAESRLSSIEKELGLEGLFDGEIYHLSFDCPKPLANAFKQATRDNGTSICKDLQIHALKYVTVYRIEKSAFGNTLRKILNPKIAIEALNFEQYCQTKPRRWIKKSPDELKKVNNSGEKSDFCMIGDCGHPAVAVMAYAKDGQDYRVCKKHCTEFLENAKNVWKLEPHIHDSKKGET